MFNKLYLYTFKLKQIVLLIEINKSKTEFHIFFLWCSIVLKNITITLIEKKSKNSRLHTWPWRVMSSLGWCGLVGGECLISGLLKTYQPPCGAPSLSQSVFLV